LFYHHILSQTSSREELLNLLNLLDWVDTIQHCFREVNSCADFLAKKGFNASFSLVLINFDCKFLQTLLVLNGKGVVIPHLVR
jgi:hypothetical protein